MRSSLWPRECKGTVQADQIRFYPRKYKDNVQTRASVGMILNPCTVQTDRVRLYAFFLKSIRQTTSDSHSRGEGWVGDAVRLVGDWVATHV